MSEFPKLTGEPYEFTVYGELPCLVIPMPYCDHCLEDVSIEDGVAYCETCLIQWDRIEDGLASIPDPNHEDAGEVCGAEDDEVPRKPYAFEGKWWEVGPSEPCTLPLGHKGKHRHPHKSKSTQLASSQIALRREARDE